MPPLVTTNCRHKVEEKPRHNKRSPICRCVPMLWIWTQPPPHPLLSAVPTLPHFVLRISDLVSCGQYNLCLLSVVGMKECAEEWGKGGIRWSYYQFDVPLTATHSFLEGCRMLKLWKHLFTDTFLSPRPFYAFPVGDWYSSTCFALSHYLGQPRMQPNAFADENFMHQGWTPWCFLLLGTSRWR